MVLNLWYDRNIIWDFFKEIVKVVRNACFWRIWLNSAWIKHALRKLLENYEKPCCLMEKSTENNGFRHLFSWKICVFSSIWSVPKHNSWKIMKKNVLFHELSGGHSSKTKEKSTENTLFCHLFSWKICVFQHNLVGDTLGKLLANHEKPCCFINCLQGVPKTMEKSRENNGFRHLFSWKICIFQYNLVGPTLGKLLENHEKLCVFMNFVFTKLFLHAKTSSEIFLSCSDPFCTPRRPIRDPMLGISIVLLGYPLHLSVQVGNKKSSGLADVTTALLIQYPSCTTRCVVFVLVGAQLQVGWCVHYFLSQILPASAGVALPWRELWCEGLPREGFLSFSWSVLLGHGQLVSWLVMLQWCFWEKDIWGQWIDRLFHVVSHVLFHSRWSL